MMRAGFIWGIICTQDVHWTWTVFMAGGYHCYIEISFLIPKEE